MIENHKLLNTEIELTPNRGTKGILDFKISPEAIVLHGTEGTFSGDKATILNPSSKVSYQVLIGRKAEVAQFMPFNFRAWHAGVSEWQGRKWLNNWSIGVGFSNFGEVTSRGKGLYRTKSGVIVRIPTDEIIEIYGKLYHSFSAAQIEMGRSIVFALCKEYPIKAILMHNEVSPGRKVDPGRAFPISKFRNKY